MPLSALTHTFAGNPLDRAGDRRGDVAWLKARLDDPEALAVAFWDGRPLVEDTPDGRLRLAYLRADLAADAVRENPERLLFLGLWKQTPVLAVELDGAADPTGGPLQGLGRFEDLRAAAATLPGPESGIAATAKSLFDWRRRHRFCSSCGQESRPVDGGWKRVCPACKVEHFPRTDPVAIMLPTFGDRCLMGRGPGWPPGRMSALAGFLEPGESIEEACARELKEEAGLTAVRVTYHSSQPWPWPSQLMIGLFAEVADDRAAPDRSELEEVRWFDRQEARAVLAGTHPEVKAPPPLAIARWLLKTWAETGT